MRKPFGPSALMISGSMIWYVSSFKGQETTRFCSLKPVQEDLYLVFGISAPER